MVTSNFSFTLILSSATMPTVPTGHCLEQPSAASDSEREREAAPPLSMTLGPSRAGLCLTFQHTGYSFVLAASAYRQQPEHKMLSNLLQAPATLSAFSLLCSGLA